MCAPTANEVETDKEKAFKQKTKEMRLLFEEMASASGAVATTGIKETAASLSQPSSETEIGIYPFLSCILNIFC